MPSLVYMNLLGVEYLEQPEISNVIHSKLPSLLITPIKFIPCFPFVVKSAKSGASAYPIPEFWKSFYLIKNIPNFYPNQEIIKNLTGHPKPEIGGQGDRNEKLTTDFIRRYEPLSLRKQIIIFSQSQKRNRRGADSIFYLQNILNKKIEAGWGKSATAPASHRDVGTAYCSRSVEGARVHFPL